MYESYYGLTAKPFQLRPDPHFFFGSKGHKRALSYLEYGLSQGEGFIVITGEVGAGKTTLMRNLFSKLESKIVAAQIVNTHIDADDILRMVAAAFGLSFEDSSKTSLLTRLEKFLRGCDEQGKRALLVVDEAQNLTPRAVEELRMLSNFQTNDKCLLQTFLLGQPEFRRTLLGEDMKQLRQRVTATYHLGPMDEAETRSYIEHRLKTVGWTDSPSLSDDAFVAIHAFSGGIPRRINTLCDRLLLMGFLEEIREFSATEVNQVIADIQQEFEPADQSSSVSEEPAMPLVQKVAPPDSQAAPANAQAGSETSLENMNERLSSMERSIFSVLEALKKMLSLSNSKNVP